jgi:hypothetical protein
MPLMVDPNPSTPTNPLDRLGIFAGVVTGLIGFLVAVACVAVPLLHFVLGPLGPAIGGLVAGRVGRGGIGRMAVSALTMAAGMAAVAVAVTGMMFGEGETKSGWVKLAPAIVFVYTAALASVGAFFGAATAAAE